MRAVSMPTPEVNLLRSLWFDLDRTLHRPKKTSRLPKPLPLLHFEKSDNSEKTASTRRVKQLLVSSVEYVDFKTHPRGQSYFLGNTTWAYDVHSAFLDALDVKFLPRRITKTVINPETNEKIRHSHEYPQWSQGCLLDFKQGDFFKSNDPTLPSLQVCLAKPMSFDSTNGMMDEGCVTYDYFIRKRLNKPVTVSQVMFLAILIYGECVSAIDIWRGTENYVDLAKEMAALPTICPVVEVISQPEQPIKPVEKVTPRAPSFQTSLMDLCGD